MKQVVHSGLHEVCNCALEGGGHGASEAAHDDLY